MNRKGQGLVEYLILVCLIGAASIAVVSLVGKNIQEQYRNVSNALRGSQRSQVSAPDRGVSEGRGMDDFMDGAKKSGTGGGFGGF